MQKLLIICGQEGTGKSTLTKRILPYLKNGASFDAENILQINPFEFNEKFQKLAIDNSVALIQSFFDHGYEQVVAGSFIGNKADYDLFRQKLKCNPKIYIAMLVAHKEVRDERREHREKPTSKEWRDSLDAKYPQDKTLKTTTGDYTYIEIDNSSLAIDETIKELKKRIPEFFN